MEGLQIDRYEPAQPMPMDEVDEGKYVLFAEAEKYHNIAQTECGKRMVAEGEVARLTNGLMKICADATPEQYKEVFTQKESLLYQISMLLAGKDKP